MHKNVSDPPLRPIVSMSGTVTHSVAKYLNDMIRPYIDATHMVKSTDEFFLRIHNLKLNDKNSVVSLDVSSLFTNVPVEETINIIIQRAYNHPDLPPPPIEQQDLSSLLRVCTQETPFKFGDLEYIQVDGVSMGSPLGGTFADFYMSQLENKLLSENKISNPLHYFRYVDDTFVIFNSPSHVHHFKRRLESNSKLNFTHEKMVDSTFHFLDLSMRIGSDGSLHTSVYIKPTDGGLYTNFQSHVPLQYKKSVVSSLVIRALKFSSSTCAQTAEIKRLKQVFANNGYPQKLIDGIIRDKMRKFMSPAPEPIDEGNTFYFPIQNLSNFTSGTKEIQTIVRDHVESCSSDKEVKVLTFFRPTKLSNKFSTRSSVCDLERCGVVYAFSCSEPNCNMGYIGHTTQMLNKRISQHRRSDSSIYKHFLNDHDKLVPSLASLIPCFDIVYSSNEPIKIKIVEALKIKNDRPQINVQYDISNNFLRLF